MNNWWILINHHLSSVMHYEFLYWIHNEFWVNHLSCKLKVKDDGVGLLLWLEYGILLLKECVGPCMYGLYACGWYTPRGCWYIKSCFINANPTAIDSVSFSMFLDIFSMLSANCWSILSIWSTILFLICSSSWAKPKSCVSTQGAFSSSCLVCNSSTCYQGIHVFASQ